MELKKAHPDLPILIRECSEVQPKLWARYGEYWSPEVRGRGCRMGMEKRRGLPTSWENGAEESKLELIKEFTFTYLCDAFCSWQHIYEV